MTWILEGTAALCLIYYGIIVCYSGMSTSFALVWPTLAIILAVLAMIIHCYHKYQDVIPVWITVGMLTAVTGITTVFVVVGLLIGLGAMTSTKQPMDYVVVLGAKVKGRELSNSLKKRLDKALEYAENNPNTMLVLSGGQGPGEDISEAQAMYDYLEFNGVAQEQLLQENQSTNTEENIRFSKDVIEQQELWKMTVARQNLRSSYRERAEGDHIKIGILTNSFHVFRAKEIAKKQGMNGVYGIAAPSDKVLLIHYWVRECFAVLKDKFIGAM
ncbi:MAG: YdcF family protein [Clostridium sp.]